MLKPSNFKQNNLPASVTTSLFVLTCAYAIKERKKAAYYIGY